jgi:Bacterial Ig-like domain
LSIDNANVNIAHSTATVMFTFSEAPSAFSLADITATGGTLSNLSGSGRTYTATYTAAAGTSIANASVAVTAGSWQEDNGNPGTGGNTGPFVVDTIAPAVTEHLLWDTGISSTDGITSNGTVTGSGDPNAVVTLTEGGAVLGTTTASATGVWTFTPSGLPQGTNTVVASETDGTGNTGTASTTFTLESIAPTVSSIAVSGAGITNGNGDLDAGHAVTLTVTFDHPVLTTATLIGKPYLKLNDGGKATYASGSGSDTLTFTYVVAAGQNTANLAVTGFSPGLIDAAGNAPLLGGAVTNPGGMLAIDTTAPTVTKVLASPASGEVTTGQAVSITLDTSEAINVSGAPKLLLNDGGMASYDAAHSTAKALAFDYTPAAGDVTTGLAVSGIELSAGAAVADLAGNAAILSGAAANLGLQINTTNTGPAGIASGNFTITGNSEIELFGASDASVIFAPGSAGTLRFDHSSTFAGTVAGLALGNYLDLADIAFKSNTAPAYTPNGGNTGGTLKVTEGASSVNIALLGNYLASSFVASSDGHGGTLVTDPPPSTPSLLAHAHV